MTRKFPSLFYFLRKEKNMLKKLHIVLIVSILFIGIFSINTYAAEVGVEHSKDIFKVSGASYVADYMIFKTDTGKLSAFVIYDLAVPNETDTGNRFKIVKNSSPLQLQTSYTKYGYKYCLWSFDFENNKWKESNLITKSAQSNGFTQTVDGSLIYSTFDVLYTDNTPFFQPAPVEVPILEAIMAMTPTIAEKIIATLRILVPFGVGLLALWIGLKILPMVLYKFL